MPDHLSTLAQALGDRYAALEPYGAGGMATVYRGRDLRHDRDVAIKVLEPSLARGVAADRFLEEVRIAAGLSHPHILPLHDSGEAAGMLYYVMPFVAGPTLQTLIEQQGRLSAADVSRYGAQLAGALDFAHRRGIVHRDVKPANVLILEGHAVLADFGVARALDAAADRRLTREGWAPGTPVYMSPEQALGSGTIDGRSDIYSLGCTLYEALAGRPPFDERAAPALLARKLRPFAALPPDLRGLPRPLVAALLRSMAPDPDHRFRDAAAFGRALEARRTPGRLRLAAAGLLVLAVAAAVPAGKGLMLARDLSDHRVAAASLVNGTGQAEFDDTGEMFADYVTAGLQRADLLDVVSTATVRSVERAFAARGGGGDLIRTLARETGARYILAGAVRRSGDSLVVHVHLNDARRNIMIGSIEPVAAGVANQTGALLEARSRATALLASKIDDRIATAPGATSPPPSFEAYRHFNEGIDWYSLHDAREALPRFRAAREREPEFTQALLFEALMLSNLGRYAEELELLGLLDLRRAELSSFDVHWIDYRRALLAGDRASASAAIRRAAEAAPSSKASFNQAVEAMEGGRLEEAAAALARLHPERGAMRGFVPYLAVQGTIRHLQGDRRRERHTARTVARLYPNDDWRAVLDVSRYAARGRSDEVLRVTRAAMAANGTGPRGHPLSLARHAADELREHGDSAASAHVLRLGIEWWEAAPAPLRSDEAARERIELLRRLGDWNAAQQALAPLLAAAPDAGELRILDGVIAAALGDRAGAAAALEWLAATDPPYTFGMADYGRARILAVQGRSGEAIAALRAAVARGRPLGMRMHQEPDLATLRRDPAFVALTEPWRDARTGGRTD